MDFEIEPQALPFPKHPETPNAPAGVHADSPGEKREWFIFLEDRYQGPITASEIFAKQESGLINNSTFVWREDFPDWITLENVVELQLVQPSLPIQQPVAFESTIAPSLEVQAWSANLDELKGIDFVSNQSAVEDELREKELAPTTVGQFIEEIKTIASEAGLETVAPEIDPEQSFAPSEASDVGDSTSMTPVLSTGLLKVVVTAAITAMGIASFWPERGLQQASVNDSSRVTEIDLGQVGIAQGSNLSSKKNEVNSSDSKPKRSVESNHAVSVKTVAAVDSAASVKSAISEIDSKLQETIRQFEVIMKETRYDLPERKVRWNKFSREWLAGFDQVQHEGSEKDLWSMVRKIHVRQTDYANAGQVNTKLATAIISEMNAAKIKLQDERLKAN